MFIDYYLLFRLHYERVAWSYVWEQQRCPMNIYFRIEPKIEMDVTILK